VNASTPASLQRKIFSASARGLAVFILQTLQSFCQFGNHLVEAAVDLIPKPPLLGQISRIPDRQAGQLRSNRSANVIYDCNRILSRDQLTRFACVVKFELSKLQSLSRSIPDLTTRRSSSSRYLMRPCTTSQMRYPPSTLGIQPDVLKRVTQDAERPINLPAATPEITAVILRSSRLTVPGFPRDIGSTPPHLLKPRKQIGKIFVNVRRGALALHASQNTVPNLIIRRRPRPSAGKRRT
jgi:hypothetical protein